MSSYRILAPSMFYPASAEIDQKLRAAAELSDAARREVVREVGAAGGFKEAHHGEIVTDLPAASLPWLLEQGLIEAIEPAAGFGLPDQAKVSAALGAPPEVDHG